MTTAPTLKQLIPAASLWEHNTMSDEDFYRHQGKVVLAKRLLDAIAKIDFDLDEVREQSPTGDDYNDLNSEMRDIINAEVDFNITIYLKEAADKLRANNQAKVFLKMASNAISLETGCGVSRGDNHVLILPNGDRYVIEIKRCSSC